MSTNKHTPGPWVYERDAGAPRPCITTVAVCCDFVIGLPSHNPGGNYRDGDPSGDPEADARLIAAAPDLLGACLKLVEWDQREKDHAIDFRARVALCDEAFTLMSAAIAKATGEQL